MVHEQQAVAEDGKAAGAGADGHDRADLAVVAEFR
jgi:hypothetical protein